MASSSLLQTTLCLALLVAAALACTRHNECAPANYCDASGGCFGCADFCVRLQDAIDGCCPCNASCTAPSQAPLDNAVKKVFQFTFNNVFNAVVDDKAFFASSLATFLQKAVSDSTLEIKDVYPLDANTTNVVVQTTEAAVDRLRTAIYGQSLNYVYINKNGNTVNMAVAGGSVSPVSDASFSESTSGSSSNSVLVPVVVVIAVVIVGLVAGAVFVAFRARRLQKEIAAVQMSGYDETDLVDEDDSSSSNSQFDLHNDEVKEQENRV